MPLSPQARMGIIAVGIIGSLFLSVGCLVGVLVWKGQDRGTGPGEGEKGAEKGKRLADRPISQGSDKDDESYIMGHRWWKKPPTKAKLDEIVRFIIETNAGSSAWVDDEGRCLRTSHYFGEGYGKTWIKPEELKNRRYFRDEASGAKRPDRKSALITIRVVLDAAEFKEGPGR